MVGDQLRSAVTAHYKAVTASACHNGRKPVPKNRYVNWQERLKADFQQRLDGLALTPSGRGSSFNGGHLNWDLICGMLVNNHPTIMGHMMDRTPHGRPSGLVCIGPKGLIYCEVPQISGSEAIHGPTRIIWGRRHVWWCHGWPYHSIPARL